MYDLNKIAQSIARHDILHNNLYEFPWLSGSSTYVYPCTIWRDTIEYQLTCYDNVFDEFIKDIVDKYSDVICDGYFWESDGSCPCTLIFKLKEGVR